MNGKLFLSMLKGLGIALVTSVVLVLLFTWLLLQTPNPDALVSLASHGAQLLSIFVGAFLAARLHREKGVLIGILTGLGFAIVVLLGSLLLSGSYPFLITLLLVLLFVGVGALGGLLGVPREKSGTARRKAMMRRMK